MALSEIIINDLVLYQTNAAISESNYHTLRQYLLERKPLLIVTNNINSLLSEYCNADKQALMNSLTQIACEAQRSSDIQEAMRDEEEKNNDDLLKSSYKTELPILEGRMNQLEMKCFHQQRICDQLRSQLREYTVNLGQVNEAIDRVHRERQLVHFRYTYHLPYPQDNVHRHYPDLQFNPIYPTLPPVYSLQDQLILDRLLNEENRLIMERQRLTYLVDSKDTESTKEERTLDKFLKEKKRAEERYGEIRQQLDIDLPNKEQQRQIRNQERVSREHARNSYDPNLQQLSHKNLETLKQQIATQNHELENKRNQLMDKAVETSYLVYITQLEQALQQTNSPQLSFNEREALKMILTLMKNFLAMGVREQSIIHSLSEEQHNLRKLQKNLLDSNTQLQHYIASEPRLVKENKELAEENGNLTLNSESADNHRTNALYASLFGTASGLLSAGLISTLVISPLFFAVPGAFALLTVISLTVALVYHFKKFTAEEQIDHNTQTIRENETTILRQLEQANDLSLTTIPQLTTQIEESEKTIVTIEKQLKDQQQAMSQLLSKAENVSSTYGGSNTFFSSAEMSSYPIPSAPLEYDLEALENYGNGNLYPQFH